MENLTRVRFTNLDKLMYPGLRLSKKDVIEYYIRVAPRILPFLRDRALVRNRYPDGEYLESLDVYCYVSKYYSGYPPHDVDQIKKELG